MSKYQICRETNGLAGVGVSQGLSYIPDLGDDKTKTNGTTEPTPNIESHLMKTKNIHIPSTAHPWGGWVKGTMRVKGMHTHVVCISREPAR